MPSLDGIKKLTSEEIDRSRKKILEIIGEHKPKIKHNEVIARAPVKMDSVANKEAKIQPKILIPQPIANSPKNLSPAKLDPALIAPKKAPDKKIIWENLRAAELKMERLQLAEENEFHLNQEKNKLLNSKKSPAIEVPIIKSAKKNNDNERSESDKKKEQEKIEKEIIAKKTAEEKSKKLNNRKINKENARRRRKAMIANFQKQLPVVFKKLFYFAVISAGVLLVLYFAAGVMLVKFNQDNPFFRKINSYIPIPVVISRIGVIDYYKYQQILAEESGNSNINSNIHRILIQNILLENFARSKGFGDQEIKKRSEDFISRLNKEVLKDDSINDVALKRIIKIKETADKNQSLAEVKKFSDDYSFGEYFKKDAVISRLGIDPSETLPNKISEIVYRPEGYYVFQVLEQFEDTYIINFVFIKGRSLNDYLNDEADKLKVWSFI
jgi:hypothetical protein